MGTTREVFQSRSTSSGSIITRNSPMLFTKSTPDGRSLDRKPLATSQPGGNTSQTPSATWSAALTARFRGTNRRKAGGDSTLPANGQRADLPGQVLTIAANLRPTAGHRSARSLALSTRAAFPKTTSFTTELGGARNQFFICSLIG